MNEEYLAIGIFVCFAMQLVIVAVANSLSARNMPRAADYLLLPYVACCLTNLFGGVLMLRIKSESSIVLGLLVLSAYIPYVLFFLLPPRYRLLRTGFSE